MPSSCNLTSASRLCTAKEMFLKVIVAMVLLHSSQLVHAQAGVIDDSQYIAGPRQRAAMAASRRQPVPVQNATYHAPTVAPTVASSGMPVLAPVVADHTNVTAVQQTPSANATSPGVGPVQAVPAKVAAKNTTTAEHASLRPANRYQTAPPPPQAAKKAANETASRRAPAPAPAKVAPPSANNTSPGVGPAQGAHAKAAARNATGAEHASLRPANRYQTAPPPPHAAKKAAKEKASTKAPAPAPVKVAQQVPFTGVPAPQPDRVPLQPGALSEAGSAASLSPDSGRGALLFPSAAPPSTEQGALPSESPRLMAASPRQEPVLAEAPSLADSPFVAALAPVPVEAPMVAVGVPRSAAWAPIPIEAPMLASNSSQAAAAEPNLAPASLPAVELSPEPVMRSAGGVADSPAPSSLAPASAAAAAPELARRHPGARMAPVASRQEVTGAPVPAAEPALEPASSKGEPEVASAAIPQSPAVAPASAAEPAPAQAASMTPPEGDSAAFLQGANLPPAPVPTAEPAPEPATSKGAPEMAYPSLLQTPSPALASASAAEPAPQQAISKTPSQADSAAFPQGSTLANAPGAQAAPVAEAAAAAPAEAPRGAAFPPSDAPAAAGAADQPRHGALQVALARPAETAVSPPESAPSPATGGSITQAAADSNSRAGASRQTIGVVQASVLSNRALPSMQAPGPSAASGLLVLELAAAPASAEAPAPLQESTSAQQAATAGPADAKPLAPSSTTPSDRQQAAIIAEAPRGSIAVVPGPGIGGFGEQASHSDPEVVRPSGEGLPGDNAAFFSTTGVLQPDAATPDNSTTTGLVKINFKSQALTSQLFRAAPGSGEPAISQLFAAAYAPLGQVQPSAYGGYSRTVGINVAQSADQASQAPALSATYAAPVLHNADAPGLAIASLQPQIGAYKVTAAPEVAGDFLDSPSPAMPAHETAGTVAFGHESYSFGGSGAAEAPSPGQKALEQLLSAASPHTQPGQAQPFTSGYFDVWAAPASCDGFFAIRARHAPLGVQPSPQHSGGAMPASRYGGGESMRPVSPARSASSVPAPAPGRSLSLHPLGAQTVLAPAPAPVAPATTEPNEAPNAAYHAGYYAGLQAARTALAAAGSVPAPAPSEAARSAATSPDTVALAAAHALARPPAPQAAKGTQQQSFAQAPLQGVYGYYGGYAARAPASQGAEFAHAPVVWEYPAEGMPAPVAAPGPTEGELVHAVSPASYGSYGAGVYAYAPEQQSGGSYGRSPRRSTDVRPAEASQVQAYAPGTASALPYAGSGAPGSGAYSMYAARPQAYYVPSRPHITASSAQAHAPAVAHSGTVTTRAVLAPAEEASAYAPPPAPLVAAALSPETAVPGQLTAQPALEPATAPAHSSLPSPIHASVSLAIAPAAKIAPDAAVAPAYAAATSAPAYAPVPSAILVTPHASVSAPAPTVAPESAAAPAHAAATVLRAYAPASPPAYAPVPSALPKAVGASVSSTLAPTPAVAQEAKVAPSYPTTTSAPASAPAYAPAFQDHIFTAGLALDNAVAPSPMEGPQQSYTQVGAQSACSKCAAYGADQPPSVEMSVSDGSELAQFSTSDGVPSNLMYFVAEVAFSHAPLSFTTQQISAANGTIIDVYPQDDCGHYLVKGYVEQPESGDPMRTDIVLSISDGAVFDCNGEAFPGSTLTSSVLNRPTGSLHTPSLTQSASGPVSNQSQVFLTLTFSQPVSSVSPADISVKLTQTDMLGTQAVPGMPAPNAGGQNRRRLAEVPALSPAEAACNAAHRLTMLQKPDSPQAVFNFLLDISDCFLGLVGVDFVGTVHNSNGAENLPVSSLQFWQVNAKHIFDSIADSPNPQ